MSGRDFYTILEITRTATQEEIKLAYRKAVVKYHPDLHKDDPLAPRKMSEVNEAYETLGDPTKRNNYDKGRGFYTFSDFFTGGRPATVSKAEAFYGEAMEDLIRNLFGSRQAKKNNQDPKEGAYYAYFNESFENFFRKKETAYEAEEEAEEAREEQAREAENGETQEEKAVYVKVTLTAKEAKRGTQKDIKVKYSEPCPYCAGAGTISQGYLTHVCDFCEGTGRQEKRKTIRVTIPGGVKTGTKVYLAGMGKAGEYGEGAGALYLEITVKAQN